MRNGSRGLFWLEPLVEVADRRTVASPTVRCTPATSPACSTRTSPGGKPTLCAMGPTEEIPYFKKQERLTFARVGITDPRSLDDYLAHGGYRGLQGRARHGACRRSWPQVTDFGPARPRRRGVPGRHQVEDGARRTAAAQKYIVCNADEGDSGTFSDRMMMEGDPFVLIEGMTIAGLAIGATRGYIYLRWEYPDAKLALDAAIAAAHASAAIWATNILGSGKRFELEVRLGAGAYICGEETSLLESLEGKRGQVRFKPPLPAIAGTVRQARP